ncbi:hypothetical protein [Spiroplasma endosymbiont of Seladonia tumulorum]|uniref:hypothetical protein n=1 Tax=Spiroplasma endosymbiont of Seladonia tumulorum TaxID=3066321 RepID=UPI0030D56B3F
MKKLLSLLSVLTISGTAVSTTIAASPYQKEETKLENNEISYLQTNNLKNLNRVKRQEITYPILEDVLIDLRKTSMKKPMQFQIANLWCVIAILKNIFDNNILNNKDLKEMEQEEITSFFSDSINDEGVSLSDVIELFNTNPIIKESLGYNLKEIDLTRLFWNRLNDIEKRMWIRHLIWESLSRQVPVIFGGFFDLEYYGQIFNNASHSALIVGIKPNKENILEDTYYVRDPWRDSEGEFILDQTTEISMTGEQIFNILFNQIENGSVLIHEDVFQLFCEKAISIFSSIWEITEPELMAAIGYSII